MFPPQQSTAIEFQISSRLVMSWCVEKQLDSFLNSEALSDEFFIEIVKNKLGKSRDEFRLRLVALSPATRKNENFVSAVFRVKIKIEILESASLSSIDVIMKVLFREEGTVKLLDVFQRERLFYEDILGALEEIWSREGEEIQIAPKLLKVETEPFKFLVLEDLSESFEVIDRKLGFNLEQSRLVLRKLAKFHAAGAVYHQQVRPSTKLL